MWIDSVTKLQINFQIVQDNIENIIIDELALEIEITQRTEI